MECVKCESILASYEALETWNRSVLGGSVKVGICRPCVEEIAATLIDEAREEGRKEAPDDRG